MLAIVLEIELRMVDNIYFKQHYKDISFWCSFTSTSLVIFHSKYRTCQFKKGDHMGTAQATQFTK